MQITIDFGYDQVFELVQQLSSEDQERLSRELNKRPIAEPSRADIEKNEPKPFPDLNEEEIAERKRRLLEKALQCPVLSEDALKKFEEARKEINECRLASW